MTRKPYNVVSNTQAGEYIKSLQGATNASCDCLLTISPCAMVNKTVLAEDRATRESDNTDESAFSDEILLNDIGQPKHFLVYDLRLSDSDCDFHSPLLCIASLKAMKNKRHRTQTAENGRRGRWEDINREIFEQKQGRRERERRKQRCRTSTVYRDSHAHVDHDTPRGGRARSSGINRRRERSES